MLAAAFAGPDSHVPVCVLFRIEALRVKLLSCASATDVHGELTGLSSCS